MSKSPASLQWQWERNPRNPNTKPKAQFRVAIMTHDQNKKYTKSPHQIDKNGLAKAPILETAMSYLVTSFTIKPCSRSSSPPVFAPHLQGLSLGFCLLPSALSFVDGIDETWSTPKAMRRGHSLELHGIPLGWGVTIPK